MNIKENSKLLLITSIVVVFIVISVGFFLFKDNNLNKAQNAEMVERFFYSNDEFIEVSGLFPNKGSVLYEEGNPEVGAMPSAIILGVVEGTIETDTESKEFLLPVSFNLKNGEKLITKLNLGKASDFVYIYEAKNGFIDSNFFKKEYTLIKDIKTNFKVGDSIYVSIWYFNNYPQEVFNNEACSEGCKNKILKAIDLRENNYTFLSAFGADKKEDVSQIGPPISLIIFSENE